MAEDDLEQKILKKVYAWMALVAMGMGGSVAVFGPSWIRDDPFTGTDAKFLEQRMEFKCKQMELSIRKDMPPHRTRSKIRNIERFLDRKYEDFEVNEYGWN